MTGRLSDRLAQLRSAERQMLAMHEAALEVGASVLHDEVIFHSGEQYARYTGILAHKLASDKDASSPQD